MMVSAVVRGMLLDPWEVIKTLIHPCSNQRTWLLASHTRSNNGVIKAKAERAAGWNQTLKRMSRNYWHSTAAIGSNVLYVSSHEWLVPKAWGGRDLTFNSPKGLLNDIHQDEQEKRNGFVFQPLLLFVTSSFLICSAKFEEVPVMIMWKITSI